MRMRVISLMARIDKELWRCKMKKLLILGSAFVHVKLIKAAQKMGIYTITTDNVAYEESPGKQVADDYWDFNIYDVDGIVAKAQEVGIDGVISGWLDPCQRPYQQICERLNLSCYGTEEQFFKMTDKHAFKKMCVENGVDIIPEYSIEEANGGRVDFPVFVKPVDSRGSRGQSVCYNTEQLLSAIEFAKSESSNGDILIEKYMKDVHEFQVTYFFINGETYLIRTVDSYCGSEENHLEKVVACAISPSQYTQLYLENAHENVIKMFKNMGYKNGPIFMQGFEDHGKFRFFDPGLRFPGVDYEMIYKHVHETDILEAMVQIALNGSCNEFLLPKNGVWLNGMRAAVLFPTVAAGEVKEVEGVDRLEKMDSVVSFLPRCGKGDVITWAYNVNQRSAEIDIVAENTESLKNEIRTVQQAYKVYDSNNLDMTLEIFDVNRIC